MPLTTHEAAVVAAYTGYLIGAFSDMHAYVEELLGRPVFTHEMADAALLDEVRHRAKADFVAIPVEAPK